MIKTLKNKFNVEIGLSDHTLTNTAALAAVAIGATAIEKHFTLDRKDIGPDSSFSIEPKKELKKLKKETAECWSALGNGDFIDVRRRKKILSLGDHYILLKIWNLVKL